MKYMFIIASIMALALASPSRGLVNPGAAGPALVPEPEPIAAGPAILDFLPISVGPAPVDYEPIGIAPAPVFPDNGISAPVAPAPAAPVSPLIQIVVNINAAGQVASPGIVSPTIPVAPAPSQPVDVVESAPVPIDVGVPIVPQPIEIGVPVLPSPSVPAVVIGTPVLPSPAVVLPEELN